MLAGRYRLIQRLGGGAMGSVWRAEDMNLRAPVAVKLIDPSIAETDEAIARFRREAQAAAAIRSTYVVQILDHGVDGKTPYIAMELLIGESLASRLERVKCLTPEKTAAVLSQVARALTLAHAQGIVHRDLKPDNVFLVREGTDDVAKVLDFGIARRIGDLGETGGLQTQTGAVLGTPFYMSSEQTIGLPVDHRSDIWSFGVIAFECLTGKRPFENEVLGALFNAICVAAIPIPSKAAAVPRGFDPWFAKAVARDREQRWQSIDEAIAQLRVVCGLKGDGSLGESVRADLDATLRDPRSVSHDVALAGTVGPASITINRRPSQRVKRLFLVAVPSSLLAGAGLVFLLRGASSVKSSTDLSQPSATATVSTAGAALTPTVAAAAAPGVSAPVAMVPVPSPSSSVSTAATVGAGGATSNAANHRVPARPRRATKSGRNNDEFVGF